MKKLLVADQSPHNLKILKNLFSKKNVFYIYFSSSIEEIKELIKKENFSLIILSSKIAVNKNNELLVLLKTNSIPSIVTDSEINSNLVKTLKDFYIIDYILTNSTYGLEYLYTLVDVLSYTKQLNVLVVCKSKEFSLKMKDILKSFLFNIKFVRSGLDALDVIENKKDIALLVCDYDISILNGFELSKRIMQNDKYSNIPILINSDSINNDLKIKFYKIGINDFISSPILEEEVKSKLIKIFLNLKQIDEINTYNKIFDENIISSSTDNKGVIKSVSSAFCRISGYSKNELIGKHHNIVRHPDMSSKTYKDLWRTIKKNKTWKGEIKNLAKDGSYYWVSAVIEPVFDKQKNKIAYYAVRQDITDKKRIYDLSITDGLTSLYNRRYFDHIAKSIIDRTMRNNKLFAFMLLDIDNFKKFNDTYGHQRGDEILVKVSSSLKETFRRSEDYIFRIGGEEFGVVITGNTVKDILCLATLAKDNLQALNIKHVGNKYYHVVTASFGLIIIGKNKINPNYELKHIYKKADEELYKAKKSGRNNIKYKII